MQATQKKSEGCPSNQVSAAAITSASDEKWRNFNFFFTVQGTGGSLTGPDPENSVGDQENGSPGRLVSFLRRLALQVKKKNLMTARVSMLLKSRASPDMLPFSLCNKKDLQFGT